LQLQVRWAATLEPPTEKFAMPAFEVGKLVVDLNRDPKLAEEFRANADAVMCRYGLTREETRALKNKDLGFLYRLGVNPYLVTFCIRHLGVGRAELLKSLAGAGPHPTEKTTAYTGQSSIVRRQIEEAYSGEIRTWG
jgi:hypothetical protein